MVGFVRVIEMEAEEAERRKPTEAVIAAARAAAAYHQLGYSRLAEMRFDANEMIRLMDKLVEALDELD